MSEPENGETSSLEGFDKEIELINSRKYFCCLCACSFETKTLFDNHLDEHMDQNIENCQNFMQYIAMACPECGETFEVASDLMLHSVNVCSISPHTCMQCNDHLLGTQWFIFHLIRYHGFNQEMLREAGLVINGYYNNLMSSFLINSSDSNSVSPLDLSNNIENTIFESSEIPLDLSNNTDHTVFNMISGSYPTIQRTERTVSSIITKDYTCEICFEAFSRKCTLDMHKKKHFMNLEKTQAITNNSEYSMTLNEYEFCTSNTNVSQDFVGTVSSTTTKYHTCEICFEAFSHKCTLDIHKYKHFMNFEETRDINYENSMTLNEYEFFINESQDSVCNYSSTVTGESNNNRATMQASDISPGSRIRRKVQSKEKFGNLKSCVTKKRKMRKKKIIAKSSFSLQKSSSSKAMLKSSIDNVDITFFKDITLRSSAKDKGILISKRMKIMKKIKTSNDYEVSDRQPSSSRATSNLSIDNGDTITFFKDIKLRKSLKEAKTLVSKKMKVMKKSKTENYYKVSNRQPNSSRAKSNSSTDNVDISIFKDIKLKSSLKEARSIIAKRLKMNRNRNTDIMDVAQERRKQKTSKPVNKTRKSNYSLRKPKTLHGSIFVCQLCNKSFKDSYKLRRHSFIHTGERPYTCSKCKKTFARDDHLKRHFKRVCSKLEGSN